MPIDVFKEQLLTPNQARRLPPFVRSNGRPADISCIYRFIHRGAKAPNGERVRLEHVRTPTGIVTSKDAIRRWLNALTNGSDAPMTTTQQHEAAERDLAAAGI